MRISQLPVDYVKYREINLNKGRAATTVNIYSIIAAAFMITYGIVLLRIRWQQFSANVLITLLLIPCLFTCIIGHELVHGLMMQSFSGVKPRYGFHGFSAYAGSYAYFGKRAYTIIALAPLAGFGIILQLCMFRFPNALWFFYVLQTVNICSAIGDIYVAIVFLRAPKGALICDIGTAMTVYAPNSSSHS